jgi:Phosphotransferase enzyme family
VEVPLEMVGRWVSLAVPCLACPCHRYRVSGDGSLTPGQQQLLARWFGEAEVVADYSWGLVDTVVLHVRDGHRDAIVKAGGPTNHHIHREITAHRRWTGPWRQTGSIGALLEASETANMLAIEYLPGRLVQDVPVAVNDPETYRQAGLLLARFHAQPSVIDDQYDVAADRKAIAWLERDHRIAPSTVSDLRAAISLHEHGRVELVPTHGDWQTRNWLVDDGTIRVIDLGRAELRPRLTDFARLARREWEGRPHLETAFFDGYGSDPREPNAWRATLLREAIGTAVWAYMVGDRGFEEQGHRMIAQSLAMYPNA